MGSVRFSLKREYNSVRANRVEREHTVINGVNSSLYRRERRMGFVIG